MIKQETSQDKKKFSLVLTANTIRELKEVINSKNQADIIYLEMLNSKTKQLSFNSYQEVKRIREEQAREVLK